MQIKSLKLKNIRSYLNQEINFPEGSTLLSGDIGSGKSTILLAIEFALFGVKRKDLPGSALLRHGKKEGSVELKLNINNKDIIIKRNLKRAKDDIKQESGYIITDETKKEATAVELKTMILEFLGYPHSLATKSKDMIYRYTVYTPQEEMKQILLGDKDLRLDTLRRVFNIDKYKRIKDNSAIFLREIKEKRKLYEGNIANLEEKQKKKREKEKEQKNIDEKLKQLSPKLKEVTEKLKTEKNNIEKIESQIIKLNKLKNELAINEANLKNKVDEVNKNKIRLETLKKQLQQLEKELEAKEKIEIKELIKKITEKENEVKLMEDIIKNINKKLNEFLAKKNHSLDLKEKITKLDKCPICEQDVTSQHKESVHKREDELLEKLENDINLYKNQEKEAENKLNELKESLNKLKEQEKTFSIAKIKIENLKEKTKEKNELEEQEKLLKKEIGKINTSKLELNEKIKQHTNIEQDYKKIKQNLEKILSEERKLELEKTALEKEKEGISKLIQSLEEEIKEKLKIKEKLTNLAQMQNWIEEHFINLMNLMEKQIMLKVHFEFDQLFQNWFNALIEDETLAVRIDDEFTPIIEQNGYETNFENLSGGEKTSVALAYRLALNKVINDIVSEIKTKEIIMLDEPTDGFSTEQLDKIRVVLEQLNIKQVIIVSHESKIESFVDNVIRVNKAEHISEIS